MNYGPGTTSSGSNTDVYQTEEYTNKTPRPAEQRDKSRPLRKPLHEQEKWKPADEIVLRDKEKKNK